jgi:hypothetical protein
MHMWHHVTNHLIISNDKDSNSENQIKLCVHDTFQSWQVPPDEAREQYDGPSQAAERGSSPPQRVWSDGPTWEQVGGAPMQVVAPSVFMARQQVAWNLRLGVTVGRP